jgi:CheY-like chemotaxis protein
MHGPEAVGIIRNDLNFNGPIIGIAVSIATSRYVFNSMLYAAGVTGNALPTDIAKLIASGANEVLTKPVTKAKLIETLRSYHHIDH